MPRHDKTIGAGALGAAHDRSQVARVTNAVERNDQRAFDSEQLVAIDVGKRIDMSGDALMIGVADQRTDLVRTRHPHGRIETTKPRQRGLGLLRNEDLLHVASATGRLVDRLSSVDQIGAHAGANSGPSGRSCTTQPSANSSSRSASARSKFRSIRAFSRCSRSASASAGGPSLDAASPSSPST